MNHQDKKSQDALPETDLLNLTVETFEIDEIDELDLNAPSIDVSLCSSTCSSSCG